MDNEGGSRRDSDEDMEMGPSREQSNYPVLKEEYPYVAMYLIVNGQIESGSIPDYTGICVKFDILSGLDWHIVSGNTTGVS